MFPLKMRSLTQSIDDEIHLAVRQEAPGKYWAFRFSDFFARIGFSMGFSSLFIYCITYMFARASGYLEVPEFADVVQGFALVIFVGLTTGVISRLARDILFKDLEQIAQSTLPRVVTKLV